LCLLYCQSSQVLREISGPLFSYLVTTPARATAFSTVNDAGIAHFSRLAALWWNEKGEFALLHKMNAYQMRFIREKLPHESTLLPPLAAVAVPSVVSSKLSAHLWGWMSGVVGESYPRHFYSYN